jgi:HSP20 family protein
MFGDRPRAPTAIFFPVADASRQLGWRPPADVYRIRGGWLVKLDLAGVRAEDLEVLASGRMLTVRGARRDLVIEESAHSYSMEISYSRFERTIELPQRLEAARIVTEYRDGMLLVRLLTERGGDE